jgi:hypothetical protein
MTSALLVKANGEVNHIELPIVDAHIMIHHKVGGWFDVVQHPTRKIHAYVHDEGLLLKQKPNVAVSHVFGQLIVGDVVISGTGTYGEEADFAVSAQTLELYQLMNTDGTLIGELEEVASKVDTTWTFEVRDSFKLPPDIV